MIGRERKGADVRRKGRKRQGKGERSKGMWREDDILHELQKVVCGKMQGKRASLQKKWGRKNTAGNDGMAIKNAVSCFDDCLV